MFLWKAVWQKLRPLAQKSITLLSTNMVPVRSMTYGLPGVSGQNVAYAVLCGGSLTVALLYVYKTMASDRERYTNRVAELSTRPKDPWESKPWPAQSKCHSFLALFILAEETTEANEEAAVLANTESLVPEADVTETVVADVTVVADTERTEVNTDAEVVEDESLAAVPEKEMLIASEVATEVLTEALSEAAAEALLAMATEELSMAKAPAAPVDSNAMVPTQEARPPLAEVAPEDTPEEALRVDTSVDVEA
ncbi:protein MGARP-like [Arapaima gigas]